MRDPNAYFYNFPTKNIDEIKKNLFIKKYDRSSSVYKETYETYVDDNTFSIIVRMNTKFNVSNFYLKVN